MKTTSRMFIYLVAIYLATTLMGCCQAHFQRAPHTVLVHRGAEESQVPTNDYEETEGSSDESKTISKLISIERPVRCLKDGCPICDRMNYLKIILEAANRLVADSDIGQNFYGGSYSSSDESRVTSDAFTHSSFIPPYFPCYLLLPIVLFDPDSVSSYTSAANANAAVSAGSSGYIGAPIQRSSSDSTASASSRAFAGSSGSNNLTPNLFGNMRPEGRSSSNAYADASATASTGSSGYIGAPIQRSSSDSTASASSRAFAGSSGSNNLTPNLFGNMRPEGRSSSNAYADASATASTGSSGYIGAPIQRSSSDSTASASSRAFAGSSGSNNLTPNLFGNMRPEGRSSSNAYADASATASTSSSGSKNLTPNLFGNVRPEGRSSSNAYAGASATASTGSSGSNNLSPNLSGKLNPQGDFSSNANAVSNAESSSNSFGSNAPSMNYREPSNRSFSYANAASSARSSSGLSSYCSPWFSNLRSQRSSEHRTLRKIRPDPASVHSTRRI